MKYTHNYRTAMLLILCALTLFALRMGFSSQAATLQGRVIRVVSVDALQGQTVNVSVELDAQGDENAAVFTLSFDPAVLTNPTVTLGVDALTATPSNDFSLAATGVIGIGLQLPGGAVFSPGTKKLINIAFTIPPAAALGVYPVTFGNQIYAPRVADAANTTLPTNFIDGEVRVVPPNPVPRILSLNPSSAEAGGGGFNLSVTGAGFTPGSVVRWGNSPRATRYISPTQLIAVILAADIASAGSVNVTVFNPAPGGGSSNPASFQITANGPKISGVTPDSANAGSPDVVITVNGSNFNSGSKVFFNGVELATTFVNDTQLTATIPASALATAGTGTITVVTPNPGGGASNGVPFTVNNVGPTLTNITPRVKNVGDPEFKLSLTGTNFVNGSIVRWGGGDRPTSFVSATALTADIPASDLATAAIVEVSVFNPAPGGGASNSIKFFVAGVATNVSAASFLGPELATESIVAAFGSNLATGTATADTIPLPTNLLNTTVTVIDSGGTERVASQFFTSPGQGNYLVPQGTADGDGVVTIMSGDNKPSVGLIRVSRVVPGVFTANSNGSGPAAAAILRVKPDGSQAFESMVQADPANEGKYITLPIDLGSGTDKVFLVLFGTGFRFRSALSAVTATIGGTDASIAYAGVAPDFIGLDQSNILIPLSLKGRGEVDVLLKVDGKTSNPVKLNLK
jgi:uncharacterized protein (TIGR03437 family)